MNFLNRTHLNQLLRCKNTRITVCSFHSFSNSRRVLKRPVLNTLQKRNMSFLDGYRFFKSKADRNIFIFYSTAGILILASISCIATWSKKKNPVYEQSFANIGAHPEIAKRLGTPLFRNSRTKGGDVMGICEYEYVIKGPYGNAVVKVEGKKDKDTNTWSIINQVVEFKETNEAYQLYENGKKMFIEEIEEDVNDEILKQNQPIRIEDIPERERPVIVLNGKNSDGKEILKQGKSVTLDESPWYYKVGIMLLMGITVGLISGRCFVHFQNLKFRNSTLVKNALVKVTNNKRVCDIIGEPIKLKGKSDGILKKEYGKLTQMIQGPKGVGQIHLQAIPFRTKQGKSNVWRITDLYVSFEGRNNVKIDCSDDF